MRILDYLLAAKGERSVSGAIGVWRKKISQAVDDLQSSHPPQSGTFVQTEYTSAGAGQVLASGTNIIMDAPGFGNIAYNNTTGIFTLGPSTSYRLTAHFALVNYTGETTNMGIEWVDAITNVRLHPDQGAFLTPGTNTNNLNAQPTTETFHTTGSAGQTVRLRVTSATGTATALGGLSYAMVQAI